MTAPSARQPSDINEATRLYNAAQKLMLGETVKCHRCLGPLRFDETNGQIGIVCDTGCTRFYLDVKGARKR